MFDLIIVNGRIVSPGGIYEASIGIEDGRIVSLSKDLQNQSNEKIDALGLLIFPGFIDAHVHFKEPSSPAYESFLTGTMAAASGGITTVFDMPGSKPNPILTRKDLEEKKKQISGKSIVDYALFGAAGHQNLSHIQEISGGGIIGYKTFMTSGPEYTAENDSTLLQVFEEISKTGLVSAVHSEVASLVELYSRRLEEQGENLPVAHPRSRPNLFESLAIHRVIELSHFAHVKAHIVHMSTAEGCQLVSEAKAKGFAISAETCPHYLLLLEDAMEKLGPYAKINPPLRKKKDQDALWHSLRVGTIDFIASDHAPHPASNKDIGWKNIWKSGAGNPGLETMAMLILTKCQEGLLEYSQVATILSENPARIYNVFPKKGIIRVGSDADFTIVDPKKSTKLDREKMLSASNFGTLYDGWEVKVSPKYTIIRGKVVAKDWEITGKQGFGEMVSPIKDSFLPVK